MDQVEIAARLAAEEPARAAWLAGVRRDLGLVCAGGDEAERPEPPQSPSWPEPIEWTGPVDDSFEDLRRRVAERMRGEFIAAMDEVIGDPSSAVPWDGQPAPPETWVSMVTYPAMITLDGVNWYEVPEGMTISEYVAQLRGEPPG